MFRGGAWCLLLGLSSIAQGQVIFLQPWQPWQPVQPLVLAPAPVGAAPQISRYVAPTEREAAPSGIRRIERFYFNPPAAARPVLPPASSTGAESGGGVIVREYFYFTDEAPGAEKPPASPSDLRSELKAELDRKGTKLEMPPPKENRTDLDGSKERDPLPPPPSKVDTAELKPREEDAAHPRTEKGSEPDRAKPSENGNGLRRLYLNPPDPKEKPSAPSASKGTNPPAAPPAAGPEKSPPPTDAKGAKDATVAVAGSFHSGRGGGPLADMDLAFCHRDGRYQDRSVVTDRDGNFRLDLEPGRWILYFVYPDGGRRYLQTIVVPKEGASNLKISG